MMKMITKKLLVVALHFSINPQVPKTVSLPVLIAGQFDAATTYHVLSNCPRNHCQEFNPIYRPFADSWQAFPAMAVADSTALEIVSHRHSRSLKLFVVGALIASHIVCGINNIHIDEQIPARRR